MNETLLQGARLRIAKAFATPALSFGPLVGRSGYALPAIDGFDWHPIGEPASDNWAVSEPGRDWTAERSIRIAPGGRGNVIIYGAGSRAVGRHAMGGQNNVVIFAEHNPLAMPVNVHAFGTATLTFMGSRTRTNHVNLINEGDGTRLVIGEDCMLSHGITLRTADEHAMVDLETGRHLNPSADIDLEPYVWLCPEVHVQKGVRIGFGSVIAARSLVTEDVPRFTLAGGIPARILRQRVSWHVEAVPRANAHLAIQKRAREV